jgi:hypothetical protein
MNIKEKKIFANLKSLNEFVEDLKKHVSTEQENGLLKDSLTYTKHIHIFGHKNCFKILNPHLPSNFKICK